MADRETAYKLNELASTKINQGDYIQAIKILESSLSKYETSAATELLMKAEALQRNSMRSSASSGPQAQTAQSSGYNNASTSQSRQYNSNEDTMHQRRQQQQRQQSNPPPPPTAPPPPAQNNSTSKAPTSPQALPPDDEAAAKHIISRTTHYDVLQVSIDAQDTHIKASYRKLALRFHPDKCQAPSSEEAFKRITAAYTNLSDAQKRRDYDNQLRYGSVGGNSNGAGTAMRRNAQGRAYAAGPGATWMFGNAGPFGFAGGGDDVPDMMNAEALFRAMFGDIGGTTRRYQQQVRPDQRYQQQRRQQTAAAATNNGDNNTGLMHFIFVILLLLFTLFSLLPSQLSQARGTGTNGGSPTILDPAQYYSSVQNPSHNILRRTKGLNLPYFVSRRFTTDMRFDPTLESQVDKHFEEFTLKDAQRQCQSELAAGLKSNYTPKCERYYDLKTRKDAIDKQQPKK